MREIFRIESPDWELSLLCQDQINRYDYLNSTLRKRGRPSTATHTQIRFSEAINTIIHQPDDMRHPDGNWISYDSSNAVDLELPLLFDNTTYQLHWTFRQNAGVSHASLDHRLQRIKKSFVFKPERSRHPFPMLIGALQTGNDIGWIRLPLTYLKSGDRISIAISLEVFSAKLDLHQDLPHMYRSIESNFPLWRFRLARSTEQDISSSRNRGDFPIMWLAQFQTLRSKLMDALKIIVNSPHSRLSNDARFVKADQLKGRIHYKTAEKVANHLAEGYSERRYRRNSKHLSVDTPENRFVKMVTKRTSSTLYHLQKTLGKQPDSWGDPKLSDAFFAELQEWQNPLKQILQYSFFKEVSNYTGLKKESLVLHQQAGYSAVYRIWQELRYYLDLFDSESVISMRSIDEIYEIWCFLEIRRILLEDLGFTENDRDTPALNKRGLEVELTDGMAGAFRFVRSDGISVKLAHEPVFGSKRSRSRYSSEFIRTYWLTQKPDIFLQAVFADGRQCVWLFDAKYRVDQASWPSSDEHEPGDRRQDDLVPEDALNQMHRYRDALIREESAKETGIRMKSRPVFGAFAIYPGFFDQAEQSNPYTEVIDEVGIGAFSLLPRGDGNSGRLWLSAYLQDQLGTTENEADYPLSNADHIFIQEPARIPYYGTSQVLYSDLALVAGLGERRSEEYLQGFRDGTANWYHCPVSTFEARYSEQIASELRYLAIASPDTSKITTSIAYVWQIDNLSRVMRRDISELQSGISMTRKTDNAHYWLFQLGKPVRLHNPVIGFPQTGFIESLRISTLKRLSEVTHHSEIEDVYAQAVSRAR